MRLKPGLCLLLAGQMALGGCISVRARSQGAGTAASSVAFALFADDGAHRRGEVGPFGVLSQLEYRGPQGWQVVFRSLAPRWAVTDLPPGRYRLTFPARLDPAGRVQPLSGKAKKFTLHSGSSLQLEAVLEHVPVGLVAAGVAVAVVVAVVLSKALKEVDLPPPPPLPPELLNLAFQVTVELAWAGAFDRGDRRPPSVTSHFPPAGAVVAEPRPFITFVFSEPLAPSQLKSQGVRVLTEKAGLVPGLVVYDERRGLLQWQPRVDLPRGEVVYVTLAADAVSDWAGNPLEADVSFSFRTAP